MIMKGFFRGEHYRLVQPTGLVERLLLLGVALDFLHLRLQRQHCWRIGRGRDSLALRLLGLWPILVDIHL